MGVRTSLCIAVWAPRMSWMRQGYPSVRYCCDLLWHINFLCEYRCQFAWRGTASPGPSRECTYFPTCNLLFIFRYFRAHKSFSRRLPRLRHLLKGHLRPLMEHRRLSFHSLTRLLHMLIAPTFLALIFLRSFKKRFLQT